MQATPRSLFRRLSGPMRVGRCVRSLSSSSSAPAKASPTPEFASAQAQTLFESITAHCSKQDVIQLSHEINTILGRTFYENEFYYRGFGGKRGGSGAAASNAVSPEAAPAAKTVFDLKLVGYDAKAKIKVIKEVRSIAGLGLKEAKELVEGAPKTIQKDLKPELAEELKAKLEEIGAQVELV
jgi:large subunit ribosomal protein L7/L12